jgi:hypothetical protein
MDPSAHHAGLDTALLTLVGLSRYSRVTGLGLHDPDGRRKEAGGWRTRYC